MEVALLKEGKLVQDLSNYPSILAFLHASNRAIEATKQQIREAQDSLPELEERRDLYQKMNIKNRGVKVAITRTRNRIKALGRELEAHRANYVEVPVLESEEIIGESWRAEGLPVNTPMDVVRALDRAHSSGLFDELRIVLPATRTARDPMIVGVIRATRANFYIASWNPEDGR